ncbi:hypothetical protein [Citrobacter sp. CF971]|uniref:hypothetical protein n=1 Tax=Citrobacter sp. CF971 TaxID=2566012 RepID=UPI00111D3444|nr:hypothetical protein [Citrobacter sp. CF971]QDE43578.1 hypothetical protein E6P06_10260 [Citrobacter sp. CF971]
MPSKLTFSGLLLALFSEPIDTIKMFFIITLGEIGRWLYGGGKLRERCGDLIICLLLFYLVKPHLVSLPPLHGVKISSGAVAIIISLLGTHGISRIFFFALKKKTGIDLNMK